MSEPFLAEVRVFPYDFTPSGWMACDGQVLDISNNQALFSLLGTTYGGDGRTTFALPDLRNRVPVGPRTGPGLSPYRLGERGGVPTVTLTSAAMPGHTHAPVGDSGLASSNDPSGTVPARVFGGGNVYGPAATDPVDMATDAVDLTGGGQAHENRMPMLGLRYCIATVGIFPSSS